MTNGSQSGPQWLSVCCRIKRRLLQLAAQPGERNTHSPCVSGDTLLGLHGREGTRDLRRGLAPAGAVSSNDAGDTDLCSVVTAWLGLVHSNLQKQGLPWWLSGKESACQCRRCGLDPWVGKIPCKSKWQPTPYSCLENPMDRGAWKDAVHGFTKSQTHLNDRAHTHEVIRVDPNW